MRVPTVSFARAATVTFTFFCARAWSWGKTEVLEGRWEVTRLLQEEHDVLAFHTAGGEALGPSECRRSR